MHEVSQHIQADCPCSTCAAVDVQKLATEREARLSMTEYELRVTLEDVVSLQVRVRASCMLTK